MEALWFTDTKEQIEIRKHLDIYYGTYMYLEVVISYTFCWLQTSNRILSRFWNRFNLCLYGLKEGEEMVENFCDCEIVISVAIVQHQQEETRSNEHNSKQ